MAARRWAAVAALCVAAACVACVVAGPSGGRAFQTGDKVDVFVNNVGPFNNPAETYEYYSLPFCAPRDLHSEKENLGEILAGDRRTTSPYHINFLMQNDFVVLCTFTLSQNEIKLFIDAIKKQYVYEMIIDGLPVKGFVGEMVYAEEHFGDHVHNETQAYLFTHLQFLLYYNGKHIIAAKLHTDPTRRLLLRYGEPIKVVFSYAVAWEKTDVPFSSRIKLHSEGAIDAQSPEVHWLWMLNTLVFTLLLTAFLAIILMRVLKKDIARFNEHEDGAPDSEGLAAEIEDSGGWKLVHGDVFRPPEHRMLLASFVGTGTQLLAIVGALLVLALLGSFYPGARGTLYSAALLLYALTAGVAGYVSTMLYMRMGGASWATNAVVTASLFSVPAFVVFSINNTVAVTYGSTSQLPFSTILTIFALWAVVTFPLTIIGALRGRRQALAAPYTPPCKYTIVRRELPTLPWYRSPLAHIALASLLPFSAIYLELHYLFISIFGNAVYTLFGVLCVTFVMLLVVSSFLTVALTYFQLSAEDYRWWWRSFLSAGSTGALIFLYALYFYFFQSPMDGFLQTCFFFGYMALVAYAFFLLLGAVGFLVTSWFVHTIYHSIKIE